MSRYNQQRHDANHWEVLRAYESMGCTVLDVSQSPRCLDLVVGCCGHTVLVEIKDGSRIPSERQLSKSEQEIFDAWRGSAPVLIESVAEAIAHVEQMRARANGI